MTQCEDFETAIQVCDLCRAMVPSKHWYVSNEGATGGVWFICYRGKCDENFTGHQRRSLARVVS
jgi:hypothetical protein